MKRHWPWIIALVILSGLVAAVLGVNLIPSRGGSGLYPGCKSSLKNIGTALEMYSTDAVGRYPSDLAHLTPNYLKAIPTCWAAGVDTYSAGYTAVARPKDRYTVVCLGRFHEAAGHAENFPQFTSVEGLVER